MPPAEGGKFGEVFVDATVGLPLIVAAVLERLGKKATKGKAKKEMAGNNHVATITAHTEKPAYKTYGLSSGEPWCSSSLLSKN